MRKILFRGKRVDNGEWVISDCFYQCDGEIKLWDNPNRDGWINVKPETIGQYIGLKDKNGKKIFEGDIVKYGEAKASVKFSSKYNLGANGYEYDYEICGFYAGSEYMTDAMIDGKVEVIANIYDNPELLEEVERYEKSRSIQL